MECVCTWTPLHGPLSDERQHARALKSSLITSKKRDSSSDLFFFCFIFGLGTVSFATDFLISRLLSKRLPLYNSFSLFYLRSALLPVVEVSSNETLCARMSSATTATGNREWCRNVCVSNSQNRLVSKNAIFCLCAQEKFWIVWTTRNTAIWSPRTSKMARGSKSAKSPTCRSHANAPAPLQLQNTRRSTAWFTKFKMGAFNILILDQLQSGVDSILQKLAGFVLLSL